MSDLISRQAAIDELSQRYIIMDNPHYIGYNAGLDEAQKVIKALPTVRFTTLSDDEIETIRIHLSAIKEKLCNQSRYGEAEYYENLIAKFLSSNVIHCKDCKHHWVHKCMDCPAIERCDLNQTFYDADYDFCSLAERRTE